nr:type II toxin-antitoxin system HicA family toxin [Candidatus Protofrankia californiensis]
MRLPGQVSVHGWLHEGRFTVVPVHPGGDIPPGTLRRVIRDAGL